MSSVESCCWPGIRIFLVSFSSQLRKGSVRSDRRLPFTTLNPPTTFFSQRHNSYCSSMNATESTLRESFNFMKVCETHATCRSGPTFYFLPFSPAFFSSSLLPVGFFLLVKDSVLWGNIFFFPKHGKNCQCCPMSLFIEWSPVTIIVSTYDHKTHQRH